MTAPSSIEYRYDLDGIQADHLEGFFVGWPTPPTAERLLDILAGSGEIVLAREPATDRVVGFINALTDGTLCAFIPLLEVLPTHQGRGIGSELTRRMLDRLGGCYSVDIVCDQDLIPFYRRFGMMEGRSMLLRRRENC